MPKLPFNDALQHAIQGNAILFLGAGFSTLFEDVKSRALPVGTKLADEMVSACNGKATKDLRVAATQLLKSVGDKNYVEFLQERFTVRVDAKSMEPAIKIASENWARIYTTNFDDGYERAAVQANKKVLSATVADNVDEFSHNPRTCIHIHGFIDKISSRNIETNLVLTLPGYAAGEFYNSRWCTQLKHDFRAAKAIFFIGYSLNDLDIAKTLNQCGLDISDKTFFIIREDGDSDLEIMLDDFGSFCPIGVSGFAEALSKIDRATLPKLQESFMAFNELRIPRNPIRPSNSDIFKLLSSGFSSEDLLLSPEVETNNTYTVQRKVVVEVVNLIEQQKPNFFAIFSEISNGKSIALYQLSRALIEKDFRVFMLVDTSRNWSKEIQAIFNIEKRNVAFIVDDCGNGERFDCISDIQRLLREGDVLVIADRTIRYESIERKLVNDLTYRRPIEFDIDILSETERSGFVSLLHAHGLWEDLQGAPTHYKDKVIKNDASNQIRGILLGIIKSPSAIIRLKESLDDIDFKNRDFDGLLMSLILTVTQAVELRQDVVDDLVNGMPLRQLLANSNGARALIQLKSPNIIKTVSAIVSETIIREFVPLDVLIRCIVGSIKNAKNFGVSSIQRKFPERIIQFRLIQQLLPNTQTRSLAAIEEIYDLIKQEYGYSDDPQFWLQYAICQLFLGNFTQAEIYFKTAYGACSRRPGYNTKFIDNHYARYILENAVEGNGVPFSIVDAENQLNKAKSLLLPQFNNNDHYPYKVATNLLPFVRMYVRQMSMDAKEGVMRFIDIVLQNAERAEYHRYINQCKIALKETRVIIEQSNL
ncbi:SIR2 family protein [Methylomonas sp. TEB]|uniref:SIR2 family protein n=1 Tax=Methylomonas sp. TEB TaxID=3398229 RepID=UPI0039F53FE3